MQNIPVWKAKTGDFSFPRLSQNLKVDIVVIGGGITGVTAAYLLKNEGLSVALIEAWNIGEGTTGSSTGNLYALVDQRLHKIESKFGEDVLLKVKQSRKEAVDFMEGIIRKYGIQCDFMRTPWHLFTQAKEHIETLKKEGKAAAEAGLKVSETMPFNSIYGIRVEDQAQFNPMQYVKAFARHAENNSCRFFENTPALEFNDKPPFKIRTPHGIINAGNIVMATHTTKGFMLLQTLLGPYREYGLAMKLANEDYPPFGIYWLMEEAKHYSFRSYESGNEKWLVAVGEHHKVGQKKDHREGYRNLENETKKYFKIASVDYHWSAQHYRPADGLPYIGKHSEGIYIATGFSTDGLVYGTTAAKIIADQITKKENPYSKIYDPARLTPIKSAGKFISKNVDTAIEFVKDYLKGNQVREFDEIAIGEGKTIEFKGHKVGAHRDEDGKLHLVSAVCTHLYCVVHFNNAEKTWDCPCHGSRFTIDGEIIEGPAMKPLVKFEV